MLASFIGDSYFSDVLPSLMMTAIFTVVAILYSDGSMEGLVNEFKTYKENFSDKIVVTLIFSVVAGIITTTIYQIEFIFNSANLITVKDLLQIVTSNNGLSYSGINIIWFILTYFPLALGEEILFRHGVYKAIVKDKKEVVIFIIISSILFGIYHFNSISRLISTTFMGGIWALIYINTKSVVYPFISHLMWNTLVSSSSLFMHYFNSDNIGSGVYQSGVATIISIIILLITSIYYYKKNGYILSKGIKDKIFRKVL